MPEETSQAEEKKEGGKASSIEWIVMLSIGFLLDLMTLISAILILLFGVGLILAKIVYFVGLIVTFVWAFFRSDPSLAMKQKKGSSNPLTKFLKNQWKKLAFRAVPALGDVIPGIWTWTIFSELKG